MNGISLGSVYALISVGFALVFNVLKFSNFSQGGLMAVTAYSGFLASMFFSRYIEGFPLFLITLFTAALAGAILGVIVERLAFRRLRVTKSPAIYYFISSITMGILLENLLTIYASSNFYSYPNFLPSKGIALLGTTIAFSDILMFSISVISLVALMLFLNRTKTGLAIRALCYNIDTVQLMGMDPHRLVMTALAISGAFGGISGVFLGINYTLYPQLGQLVVKGFIASVLGGLGSLPGAVMGGLLLGIVEVMLIGMVGSGWSPVFIFVIMLAFLLIRPRGIAGIIVQEKA